MISSFLSVVSASETTSIIKELANRGFLRRDETPKKYRASNFPKEENIKNMGVWFHITNHCNLGCEYCFVNKDKEKMSEETLFKSLDLIYETAIKRNLESVNVKFAGGEPALLTKDIVKAFDYLDDKFSSTDTRFSASILSNGTVLNEKLIELLKRKNIGIGISLDGYGSESHDIHRRFVTSNEKGSWKIIMSNIEKMLDEGIRPYIMSTISEESADTLPKLVKWVFSNGLKTRLSVVRQPGNTWSNVKERADEYERLTKRMIEAFECAFLELEDEKYKLNQRNALNICELHFESPVYAATCGIAANHIVIQEDGLLASCPMTLKETNIEPKEDLLTSIKETFPYDPKSRNTVSEFNCLDCNWYPVCTSGCPVNNERVVLPTNSGHG